MGVTWRVITAVVLRCESAFPLLFLIGTSRSPAGMTVLFRSQCLFEQTVTLNKAGGELETRRWAQDRRRLGVLPMVTSRWRYICYTTEMNIRNQQETE